MFSSLVKYLTYNAPNCLHTLNILRYVYVFELCAESLKSSLETLQNVFRLGFSVYAVFQSVLVMAVGQLSNIV